MKEPPHPALAQGKVRYVGDAVAFVVAETLEQARTAAEAVEVDYEVLPAVVGVLDALKPGAPAVFDDMPDNFCCDWELGDKAATDAAFKKAAHVPRISLVNNRLVGNPMEPRAAIGEYDRGTGHYTLWTTSQFPHVVRLLMGNFVLNIPQHKLRVVAPDVGGGFGVKQFHYAEEAVVTWAARKVGRPVKWVCERSEGFISDAHGRDHVTEAELALDENGKFLGLRVTTIANMGGYLSTFGPNIPTNLYGPLLAGVYTTPAIYCEVKVVFTNTVPVDAYRGAGRPEATFVLERLVDVAASEMGIDRVEIRRRNMIPKEAYPYQTPVMMQYDSGDPIGCLDKALVAADWTGFAQRKAESAERGKFRGIGMCTYVEACGLAPSRIAGRLGARGGLFESATVRVHPTGAGHRADRHAQSRPGPRDDLRPDRVGEARRAGRQRRDRVRRHRQGAVRHGHLRLALARGRRFGAGRRRPTRSSSRARRSPRTCWRPARRTSSSRAAVFSVAGTDRQKTFGEVALSAYVPVDYPLEMLEPGLEEQAFYDPVNFTFPAARISPRSRSIPRPAIVSWSTTSRSTTSARSSIR